MASNQSPSTQNNSDEIDLGQLFQLIGRGFNAVFRWILRVFLYLKKNMLLLIGLVVVGLAIGYGLNKIISKMYKTEVIVKPQIESKNYLYDVVGELQSNIKSKDTLFFKSIGVDNIDFDGLNIEISRVAEVGGSESDIKYLELLQSFENTDAIADIVRAELQNKSSFNHRITFYYKNAAFGKLFAEKILSYINTNTYFNGLLEVYKSNAKARIGENEKLLVQVDEIITNYTTGLANKGSSSSNDRIVLDNQEQVNIADIFEYKTGLIRDIESKKLELEERKEPVSVINLGQPQVEHKSFFGKSIVLIPIIFVSLFFILSILVFLNKKSKLIH
ncbi:hypothetical protein CLV90_0384 [Maribacter spongiicola]|uniref:Subunit length determinant protein n=1 Tax=Maribacter spongiicola TaxID=1206753 RepID=A0A4R7K8Q7_9FLAO|nr:hypothetical protein [Maribacter spongiicola]TDT46334.1 hypothetical protein CLV90_0384 [Maribacter spongiicola]